MAQDPSRPEGSAVGVMLAAAWLMPLVFAVVQAPAVGEGVVSFSLFCVMAAGLLGTLGALWWSSGKLRLSPSAAIVGIVLVSWWIALGAGALVPRAGFARLDLGLGIRGVGQASLWTFALIQPLLALALFGAARLMRSLESKTASQRAEDAVARRLHDALVPDVDVRSGSLAIWGRSVPCSATGGDFIEVFDDSGVVTVVVGDVSGHGVGAGILMAMIKGALRVRLRQEISLDRLLGELNELVLSLDRPGVFVTATAVRAFQDGRVETASAGHLPIIRLDPTSPKRREIPNECLPLGVESEERYLVQHDSLSPGELLAILTDGMVEVQDRNGRQIGMPLICKVLTSRQHAPLPEIFSALASRCESFGKQMDDQTLVLLRFGERAPTLEPLPTPMDDILLPEDATRGNDR
jgi:hypothetical protein